MLFEVGDEDAGLSASFDVKMLLFSSMLMMDRGFGEIEEEGLLPPTTSLTCIHFQTVFLVIEVVL